MLSLLIVDDKAVAADGLYHAVQERYQDQLLVRRCYSYAEAEEILEKNRIDILVTEIELSGGTGLALHRQVHSCWPMSRVIYWTRAESFAYARQAIDQSALAYVLKREGEGACMDAIGRAIRSFDDENDRMLRQSGSLSERPRHLRQLVFHALHGGFLPQDQLTRAIADSGIGLSLEKTVYLGHCYFDDSVTVAMLHQAMTLIERVMYGQAPLLLTDMNAGSFVILYQLRQKTERDVLMTNLEAVQRMLEHQGSPMTVCLMEQPVSWSELGLAGVELLQQTSRVSPAPGEMVMLTGNTLRTAEPQLRHMDSEWTHELDTLQRMHEYILTGQKELFFAEEPHFWELVGNNTDPARSRVLYSALSMFMDDCARSLPDGENISRKLAELASTPHMSLDELQRRMKELGMAVFNARAEKQNHRQKRLVGQIDDFINEHLSGDLSLTAISEALHFHPTYISRVYKEFSGDSLSDAIAKKRLDMACTMLRETEQPIAVIAMGTGFSTANYFARWFRKWMNCTAQEYRDKQRL